MNVLELQQAQARLDALDRERAVLVRRIAAMRSVAGGPVLDALAKLICAQTDRVAVFHGGIGKRARRRADDLLATREPRAVLATGRYIGEGFDDPRLDTLMLAMPIAWKGTTTQYAGRLHRHHDAKHEIRIIDYVDNAVPVLRRMFAKRQSAYASLGYAPG